jgi:hypothetical protein
MISFFYCVKNIPARVVIWKKSFGNGFNSYNRISGYIF